MKLAIADEEDLDIDILARAQHAVDLAWRDWRIHSCQERHGGHLWRLDLDHPDNPGVNVHIGCTACPMQLNDWIPDGDDLFALDAYGIRVQDGRHNAPTAMSAPVSVRVESWRMWTDYGYEWDMEITVEVLAPFHATEEAL